MTEVPTKRAASEPGDTKRTASESEIKAPDPEDEPLLPSELGENDLREAIGAKPLTEPRPRRLPSNDDDDDDDDDGDGTRPKRPNRTVLIATLAVIVGVAIAAMIFFGHLNAQRYLITCSTDNVAAEQGRSFPPWGSKRLVGAEWKPIALPPNAECTPRETDAIAELEGWFLAKLVERASATLTASNILETVPGTGAQKAGANPLDGVAAQLNQALLLSRSPDRRDERKEVERLLGDVQYWRASAKLREASAALLDASKQFDTAAAQRPRHVNDAAAWAAFLRKLADDLRAGPNGVPTAVFPPLPTGSGGPTTTAPPGTALPVEPPEVTDPPHVPPDAGLPTGGVLL